MNLNTPQGRPLWPRNYQRFLQRSSPLQVPNICHLLQRAACMPNMRWSCWKALKGQFTPLIHPVADERDQNLWGRGWQHRIITLTIVQDLGQKIESWSSWQEKTIQGVSESQKCSGRLLWRVFDHYLNKIIIWVLYNMEALHFDARSKVAASPDMPMMACEKKLRPSFSSHAHMVWMHGLPLTVQVKTRVKFRLLSSLPLSPPGAGGTGYPYTFAWQFMPLNYFQWRAIRRKIKDSQTVAIANISCKLSIVQTCQFILTSLALWSRLVPKDQNLKNMLLSGTWMNMATQMVP